MNKILVLILVLAFSASVGAREVSEQQASSKAVQWMEARIDKFDATVLSVKAVTYNGRKAYYVVQFAPQGWALVSADDTSAPLIGYSAEGTYQTDHQPYNVEAQMGIFAEQVIDNARRLSLPHEGWAQDESMIRRASKRASSDNVSPLITVNWNQNGAYWKYCPVTSSGQHAYVGCVAVGMAQAMSVAKWPAHATGSKGYEHSTFGWLSVNYDNEPGYNWDAILTGANGYDDVARLLWHCGMSVTMDYGTGGSGAQTSAIAGALRTYFGYPSSATYYSRSSFSESDWKNLILTELKEGRAVAYSGHDPKKNYGHCFNLDGYDGSWFHVNWGWGGANNGYFGLDALRDATMDMDYTDGQGVVIGIRPPSEYPMNIVLSNLQVAADAPVGTVVAAVSVESEATNPTYTFTLRGARNPITKKYASVPFTIEDMKLITTEAMPAATSRYVEIIVKNNENGHELSRAFTIQIVGSTSVEAINIEDGQTEYFDISGRQLSTLQKGLNIVRQRKADGSAQVKKVVVK